MRPHDEPYGLCSVDPITAAATLAFGAVGSMFGGGGKKPAETKPVEPPPQAPPASAPAPKQGTQTSGSSFIGGVPTPPPSTGGKSLLGQ